MLYLIIICYKHTINVSSYLQEYIKYPVDYTYNNENYFLIVNFNLPEINNF